MRFRFVLGIGRSGTTFLSDVLALSTSSIKYVVEPMPRVWDLRSNNYIRPWFVLPRKDSEDVAHTRRIFESIALSNKTIRDDLVRTTVPREDREPEFILIKEVHGLLAFPLILSGLNCKAVVITRDTLRVLDSYFHKYRLEKSRRTYLVDDYYFLRQHLLLPVSEKENNLINTVLESVSPRIVAYLRRPILFSREIIRQACVTELVRNFLVAWAELDNRVMHIRYEDLCVDPVLECKKIYSFFGLSFDGDTLEKIVKRTQGTDDSLYSTNKNSLAVLNREFRFLSRKQQWAIRKVIENSKRDYIR